MTPHHPSKKNNPEVRGGVGKAHWSGEIGCKTRVVGGGALTEWN